MFKVWHSFMARSLLWLDTLLNSALSVVLGIMQRHAPAKTLPCQTSHIKTLIERHSQHTDYWSAGKVSLMNYEILVSVSHQDNPSSPLILLWPAQFSYRYWQNLPALPTLCLKHYCSILDNAVWDICDLCNEPLGDAVNVETNQWQMDCWDNRGWPGSGPVLDRRGTLGMQYKIHTAKLLCLLSPHVN